MNAGRSSRTGCAPANGRPDVSSTAHQHKRPVCPPVVQIQSRLRTSHTLGPEFPAVPGHRGESDVAASLSQDGLAILRPHASVNACSGRTAPNPPPPQSSSAPDRVEADFMMQRDSRDKMSPARRKEYGSEQSTKMLVVDDEPWCARPWCQLLEHALRSGGSEAAKRPWLGWRQTRNLIWSSPISPCRAARGSIGHPHSGTQAGPARDHGHRLRDEYKVFGSRRPRGRIAPETLHLPGTEGRD